MFAESESDVVAELEMNCNLKKMRRRIQSGDVFISYLRGRHPCLPPHWRPAVAASPRRLTSNWISRFTGETA